MGGAGCFLEGQGAEEKPAATPEAVQPSEADTLWQEISRALKPPAQPKEWAERAPTAEERAAYRRQMGESAAATAEKARDFCTRFPKHARVEDAKRGELQMLQTAQAMGNDRLRERLTALEDERMRDPKVPEMDRVRLRAQRIQKEAMEKAGGDQARVATEMERGARALLKEFPTNPVPYQMLISVAGRLPEADARRLASELRDRADAPDRVRRSAAGLLKKIESVGKPLELAFTALDGREVSMEKLRGKVVLIDFWATWCGPCRAELPNVRAAYAKLHPRGLEIVGISLDNEKAKESLTKFVAKEEMSWPQHFDGKGWENEWAQRFGIDSIPAMWLVDKKGVLRDQSARGNLEEKVEKLLKED